MNLMEKFLTMGAVVSINFSLDDEIYKFIKLMKSVGFLKEYAEYFEQKCCTDKFGDYSSSHLEHLIKLNGGNLKDTCFEFQWGKGFTWGNKQDYLKYDEEIEIITIDDLIRTCHKEEIFQMNGIKVDFVDVLEDKESASVLDDFLEFYDWSIHKYPDGTYNIKDEQCNSFDFEENTTLKEVTDRVYGMMLAFFENEEDYNLDDEDDLRMAQEKLNLYIKIGENLNLLSEASKNYYKNLFN